jgi:hypothetical protein
LEAFVTEVDVVLHAKIAGFALRVVDTGSHLDSFSVALAAGPYGVKDVTVRQAIVKIEASLYACPAPSSDFDSLKPMPDPSPG